jgi:hypothetical protein
MDDNLTQYHDYDHYIQQWNPPLHPSSEEDLTPMNQDDFYTSRHEECLDDEKLFEEHFGDLEPLDMSDTIDLIQDFENLNGAQYE